MNANKKKRQEQGSNVLRRKLNAKKRNLKRKRLASSLMTKWLPVQCLFHPKHKYPKATPLLPPCPVIL